MYAFYSSWRVALVILALLPVVSFAAFALMQLNQNQTQTAQKVSFADINYSMHRLCSMAWHLSMVPRRLTSICLERYRH